jgi:hypothetical protein
MSLGFTATAGATVGSVVPGAGNLIGTVAGLAAQFLIKPIVSAFRGRTEQESYAEDILPIIQPFIQRSGISVAVYHYQFVWILTPSGELYSPTGEQYVDGSEAYELVQEYANATGEQVGYLQFLTSYMDGRPWLQLFKPEYSLASPDFTDTSFASTLEEQPPSILKSGVGGIAAGVLLLLFVLGKKK